MYPFDLNDGAERYQDMLREAEEYRRSLGMSVPNESLFSRVAKLFDRSNGQTPSNPIGNRPATSAR